MALTPISGTTNTYTVSNINDLTLTNVTNLFNTGNPLVPSAITHAGAATVEIPLASLFQHGGGRYVNLGDFGLVQDLVNGTLQIPAGTYTIQQLINDPNIGPINISFVTQQAFLDQYSSDYVERAYLFNTQEYVLDQSSTVEIDGNGGFNFLTYEIRIDRENGSMVEDFDFEGGYTSWLFNNLVGAPQIESDIAQSVTFEYVGVGNLDFGYTNADYQAWLANTPVTQRASEANPLGTLPFFSPGTALRDIVDELVNVGILPASCFGAGTPIDMWPLDPPLKPGPDGTYDQDKVRAGIWEKPIEEITASDVVVSFDDKTGNLVPGTVTRTMTNNSKIILDFHGTFVTPGHVYWCAGGKYEGKYAPLIDILRDDGVIQHQDGTLIRASTGCEVGTTEDEEFHVFKLYKDAQGSERVRDKTKLRYGTRWMMPNGQHCTMREYLEGIGVEILQEGPQRGYARWKETGMTTLFAWVLSDTLPQPEDFVLARSAASLEDIYKAGQWEFMQPTMPPPMVMDGGPVQPLSERKLEMMPRNQPMAFSSAAQSSEMLPDRNPQMNRRQRKAAEAKANRAAKNKRPKGATLH